MPLEIYAIAAVVIAALAQAITGIGFALICGPLLILFTDVNQGVILTSTLGLVISLLVIRRDWRHANLKQALALFIPACAVAPIGWFIVEHASTSLMSILAGVLVLGAVVTLASGLRWRRMQGSVGAVIAGGVSGLMSLLAGIGGPAVAIYAMNANWDTKTLRATLNVYFVAITFVTFAVRGTPSVDVNFGIGLLLAVFVGFCLGSLLTHRLEAKTVRSLILVVAAIGGIAAIVNGLS